MGRDTGQHPKAGDGPTADEVAAYLRANPDFLVRHPDLAAHLAPPAVSRGDGVVDLQHFMLERLRREVERLKDEQRDLLSVSRTNLHHQHRIHAAVLELLDAQSFEELIQTITFDLAVLLDVDVARLIVESNGQDIPHVHSSGVRVVEPGTVDLILGKQDVLLRADVHGESEVFEQASELVRSEALIRLRVSHQTPDGLIAFGSRDPEFFHPGQATELIAFLARVIERCIRAWLDLPP